jgi:hypothetical protein
MLGSIITIYLFDLLRLCLNDLMFIIGLFRLLGRRLWGLDCRFCGLGVRDRPV